MSRASHFTLNSSVASPSADEVLGHLERTWQTFHELFGVAPGAVHVVLGTADAATAAARCDQGAAHAGRVVAWSVAPGEDLGGRGFSDLSHEIAHLYLIDLMRTPPGTHQTHAWLHEAVACLHESPAFVAERERWIREHLAERTPLARLFEMRNPVKESALVELTVELHGRLARGEIDVSELNRRISAWASRRAGDLIREGVRNMTWYAQSASVLRFLFDSQGRTFVRAMVRRLAEGARMEEIVAELPEYPAGVASLEAAWVDRVGGRSV